MVNLKSSCLLRLSFSYLNCMELLGNLVRKGNLLYSASLWIHGVEVVRLAVSGFNYMRIIEQ